MTEREFLEYPDYVIEIHVPRIPAEEFVTSDQIANCKLSGWRLALSWAGFLIVSACAWYALGYCALRGIERAGR